MMGITQRGRPKGSVDHGLMPPEVMDQQLAEYIAFCDRNRVAPGGWSAIAKWVMARWTDPKIQVPSASTWRRRYEGLSPELASGVLPRVLHSIAMAAVAAGLMGGVAICHGHLFSADMSRVVVPSTIHRHL